jgi:hypothetical protein
MTKTRLVLFIALLFLNCQIQAQIITTYSVIKVNGKVVSKLLNREIRSGDLVKSNDQLVFESKDSYVHIINSEGRKTLRNIPDNSPRELMQLMQTFLSQDKNNKTSRGTAVSNLESIKKQLFYDTLLILGKGTVSIDTTQTTLRSPAGVSMSYQYQDKKITKIISDKTGFNVGRSSLFSEPDISMYPKVTVMYNQDTNDPYFSPSVLLGAFVPYYVNEEVLQKELITIINTFKATNASSAKTKDEIIKYLSNEYAIPIQENVNAWLIEKKLLN